MTVTPDKIEALLDAAFGTDRHLRTAYKLRAGTDWLPDLSFAAVDDVGALIGSLQSWPVAMRTAEETQYPLTLVGPVAVAPAMQRVGIGRMLMDRLITDANALPMVMIGDPEYYGRFYHFSADATGGWDVPGPVERHRLLARGAAISEWPKLGMLGSCR